jgi:hypothetical protein
MCACDADAMFRRMKCVTDLHQLNDNEWVACNNLEELCMTHVTPTRTFHLLPSSNVKKGNKNDIFKNAGRKEKRRS